MEIPTKHRMQGTADAIKDDTMTVKRFSTRHRLGYSDIA